MEWSIARGARELLFRRRRRRRRRRRCRYHLLSGNACGGSLTCVRGDGTATAVIEFDSEAAAKTALLLTHAWIKDSAIVVEPFEGDLPEVTPVRSEAETAETGDVDVAEDVPEETTTQLDPDAIPNKDFGGQPPSERVRVMEWHGVIKMMTNND